MVADHMSRASMQQAMHMHMVCSVHSSFKKSEGLMAETSKIDQRRNVNQEPVPRNDSVQSQISLATIGVERLEGFWASRRSLSRSNMRL